MNVKTKPKPSKIIETSKMGNAGHVVVPLVVRKRLNLQKGSHITWTLTENNQLLIEPLKAEAPKNSDEEFETAVKNAGYTSVQDWQDTRAKIARDLIKEMYGIDVSKLPHA